MANTSKTTVNGNGTHENISVQDLSEQLEILKNDIAGLSTTLGEYTRAKGHEATATAKAKAHDLAEGGREKALEAQMQAEEFVRTQPASALGIAAGLGFLVGVFTARR